MGREAARISLCLADAHHHGFPAQPAERITRVFGNWLTLAVADIVAAYVRHRLMPADPAGDARSACARHIYRYVYLSYA
jgi:hypothetical protein